MCSSGVFKQNLTFLSFYGVDMHKGDHVAVYSDVDGLCRKGFTQRFTDNRVFVGNGVAEIGREDLFCSVNSLR